MQKSGKVWKNGVSFLIVFILAFTSVFFNITSVKAAVEPDKVNSGVYLGMTLVDITGMGYYENAAADKLELVKGEEYNLKVRLGYQDEDSPGGIKYTKINDNEVYVYRNNVKKTSFAAFTTGPKTKNSKDVNVVFKAGEGSQIGEDGTARDYIEVNGKTGGFGIGIILSSHLVYNLKLKADFYYEGKDKPEYSQTVAWNNNVYEIKPENKIGSKFKGWYYRNDATKKFNFDEPIKDNVELVAKYEDMNSEDPQKNENNEVATVKVFFQLENGKNDSTIIDKGSKFIAAKESMSKRYELSKQLGATGNIDVDKYDWYEDSTFQKKADDNEKIEADRTYYGQLKKEKVNVTFRVGDIDKEKVTIEKGQTFNDAKKAVTFNISEYEWFEDDAFDTPAVVDKQILENKIYFGKLKVTANNGNNDNNGDNNNNNNNGNNGDNNNNNNNNNNDNNGNNNNNGNTTPVVPTVPSNNITIPDETTPLSPTTPDTEDKDTNDNINIEDDDTALGTAVIDDKSEDEDATIPVKDGKKVTANEDNSVDIASEDTPLGTTLPKTGGSLGITYILLGLLISVLGIKKFREK